MCIFPGSVQPSQNLRLLYKLMRKRWDSPKNKCLSRLLRTVWPRILVISQLCPSLGSCCLRLCLMNLRWTFSKLPVLGSFNAGRRVPHVSNLTVFTLWRLSRPLDVILVRWEASCCSTEASCHTLGRLNNLLHSNRVDPVLWRLLA